MKFSVSLLITENEVLLAWRLFAKHLGKTFVGLRSVFHLYEIWKAWIVVGCWHEGELCALGFVASGSGAVREFHVCTRPKWLGKAQEMLVQCLDRICVLCGCEYLMCAHEDERIGKLLIDSGFECCGWTYTNHNSEAKKKQLYCYRR